MDIDRKTVIWHPDDAKHLDGKQVIAFDCWYDTPVIGTYKHDGEVVDYPFHVDFATGLSSDYAFIAPAPENKYRPFANAKEFAPHRDEWVTDNGVVMERVIAYDNKVTFTSLNRSISYAKLFEQFSFENGSPCGKEITT